MNKDIESIVHHRLTGTSTPDEDRRLDEWLTDPDHRTLYERILNRRNLAERYRQYRRVNADKGWKTFRSAYLSDTSAMSYRRILRYAALLVVVIGSAYMLLQRSERQPSQSVPLSAKVEKAMRIAEETGRQAAVLAVADHPDRTVSLTTIEEYREYLEETPADVVLQMTTGAGKEFWLTLDDGTRVHLNNSSSLKYPATFAADNRTVYLDGEAYFKVAKDAARPFYVTTRAGIVKEYGTEFTVNTRSAGGATEVVLIEGAVSVIPSQGQEAMMKPGQRAVMTAGRVGLDHVDTAPYKAWSEGEYIFKDTRMDVLMDVLSHWYGVSVEYEDAQARDIRFTGSFDRYARLDPILKAISSVTGLHIERQDSKITVRQQQ